MSFSKQKIKELSKDSLILQGIVNKFNIKICEECEFFEISSKNDTIKNCILCNKTLCVTHGILKDKIDNYDIFYCKECFNRC